MFWAVVSFTLLIIFCVFYARFHHKHSVHLLAQISKLQWIFMVILHCLALPFGVATARVFHCTNDNKFMDVDNNIECFSGQHWAYMAPVIAVWLLYFGLFTFWLGYKTHIEMLSMPSHRHEAYLQLKEIEFVHKLDSDWMVGHFHVFSSFRKWGAQFRCAAHAVIAVVLILYASLRNHIQTQAVIVTCIFLLAFVTSCIVRPYRVPVFNFSLCFSLFCLFSAFLTGSFIASFDFANVRSVYLTEDYMTPVVAIILILFFVFGIIAPLCYVIIRHNQRTCCPCCLRKEREMRGKNWQWRRRWQPLWPALATSTIHKMNPETRKFVRAILLGRILCGKLRKYCFVKTSPV